MAKKFGLGKGLGALIPEDNIKEEKKEKGGIINIELKDIKANKKQPRKFFDNNKLNELAESVKEHGIIQPLILKKEEKGYSSAWLHHKGRNKHHFEYWTDVSAPY